MKKTAVVVGIVVLTLITLRFLFIPGFYPMHDDAQVARVVSMGRALHEGQFPVRIVPGLGYGLGYPIFNFYGPLPYYVGGALYVLGISGLVATKIMIGAGIFIGVLAMYFFGSYLFGLGGGLASSLFFILAPYRALQIYVRGAVGELWATSFIPLVLLGCFMLGGKKHQSKGFLIATAGLFGVILSHTVFGFIVVGTLAAVTVCFLLAALVKKSPKTFPFILSALLLISLDLTAFFWLPALFELNATNVGSVIGTSADFHNHFVCLVQLWDSPWGYGGSAPGCGDGMSFRLGKPIIITFAAALSVFIFRLFKHAGNGKAAWGMTSGIIIVLSSVIFMTSPSAFLWDIIPFSSFIQYPWRLLAFASIGLSLSAGYLYWAAPKIGKLPLLVIFIIGLCIVSIKLFAPQYVYEKPPSAFESKEDISFRASKVSDEYLPIGIPKPESQKDLAAGRVPWSDTITGNVITETTTNGEYSIYNRNTQPVNMVLHMAYVPGWRFWINGKAVTATLEKGQPSVILSQGENDLVMHFEDTTIRVVGNVLSLVTVIFITLFYAKEAIR